MTRVLPRGYLNHPHASEEARKIAEDGMILRAEVGSGVHGTAIAGTDDRDELGVCIEPPEYVIGLRRFDQFERHTAWDRGGLSERSGAGDLDVTVYSARKFCRLALDGNPSIITLLFVPPESIVEETEWGRQLRALAPAFVSLRACDRYLGYLRAQRKGLTGQGRVNRPELVKQFGYDVKFAGHAVRLGVQGHELMWNGQIQLPMSPYWRTYIQSIRRGEVRYDDVMRVIGVLEDQLDGIRNGDGALRGIPEQPDRALVDRWLYKAYDAEWSRARDR